jgi:hypothetical protein
MNNELGIQAAGLSRLPQRDEHGDMTALAVYISGQPRPTTKLELSSRGLLEPATRVDCPETAGHAGAFRPRRVNRIHVSNSWRLH